MTYKPCTRLIALAVQLLLLAGALVSAVNAKSALGGYQPDFEVALADVASKSLNVLDIFLDFEAAALGCCIGPEGNLPDTPNGGADNAFKGGKHGDTSKPAGDGPEGNTPETNTTANNVVTNTPPRTDYSAVNQGPLGNPNDSTSFASTFRSGNYTDRTLSEDTVLYRVIPDDGNPSGAYWTSTPPQGPLQSVIDSALDQNWGNTATRVVRARVPAGTRIFEGVAAPQRGLVGGGNQIVFDRNKNPFNPEWIIDND